MKPVQTFLSCLKENWKTLKEFVKKKIFYLNMKDFRNKCNILFFIVTHKKLLTGQRFLFHIFIDSPIKRKKNQSVWCTLTTCFIECAQYFNETLKKNNVTQHFDIILRKKEVDDKVNFSRLNRLSFKVIPWELLYL